MTRILPLMPDQMTARQQQVSETIASGPRGAVRGPLAVWLYRPELADRAQALGQYCRFESCLPPRLSELAILVTARLWNSEYEWAAHKPIALKGGLAPEIVEAIRCGREPAFAQADEAVVYRFATSLHQNRHIDDALYADAVAILGDEGVVDLTGILGYYTLISMTINVFKVATADGHTAELGPVTGSD
ncbi:MAG: carboxymuconolactone decarboxylase family protein [Rhodospirillales bacterium]|nr:carboxymuconolactone decarboxylase family protein [Rhodospirillales bacterium]